MVRPMLLPWLDLSLSKHTLLLRPYGVVSRLEKHRRCMETHFRWSSGHAASHLACSNGALITQFRSVCTLTEESKTQRNDQLSQSPYTQIRDVIFTNPSDKGVTKSGAAMACLTTSVEMGSTMNEPAFFYAYHVM